MESGIPDTSFNIYNTELDVFGLQLPLQDHGLDHGKRMQFEIVLRKKEAKTEVMTPQKKYATQGDVAAIYRKWMLENRKRARSAAIYCKKRRLGLQVIGQKNLSPIRPSATHAKDPQKSGLPNIILTTLRLKKGNEKKMKLDTSYQKTSTPLCSNEYSLTTSFTNNKLRFVLNGKQKPLFHPELKRNLPAQSRNYVKQEHCSTFSARKLERIIRRQQTHVERIRDLSPESKRRSVFSKGFQGRRGGDDRLHFRERSNTTFDAGYGFV